MKKRDKAIIAIWIISLLVTLLPMYPTVAAVKADIKHNPKFDETIIEHGIDVSYHQGEIDWKKVKADGIQFAFIRVANRFTVSGELGTDKRAYENMQGAKEAGIPFGVYIFSHAITVKEAREEADYILGKIDGYDIELPVVFDFEYYPGGRLEKAKLSDTERTNICLAFCKRIENAGYEPMVYANKSMLKDDLNAAAIDQSYPIWLAHYTKKTDYEGEYQYWQYTSSGSVDGISGRVDMNVRYVKNNANRLAVVDVDSEGIHLALKTVANAISYEIYRRTEDTEFELYDTVEASADTQYTDKNAKANIKYFYQVRAVYAEEEYGELSGVVMAYSAITNKTTVSKGTVTLDTVPLKWNPIEGAEGYEIWKYSASKKAYVKEDTIIGKNNVTYTDEKLKAGTTYTYKVRAYRTEGKSTLYGPYSKSIKVKTVSSEKGRVTSKSLNVRAAATTSSKKLTTLKKNTVLTLTGISGDWYQISVTIKGKKKTAYVSKSYVQIVRVAKPTAKKKSASFDKIKLSWSKVSGADGYVVQRYNSSKKAYETQKTITKGSTVSYTNSNLNASTTYKYRVRAYKKIGKIKVYGSYSTTISAKTSGAKSGKITASKVNLRKGTSTRYAVVKTVKKGTKVSVTGSRGSWYRVSITVKGKKKTAYVSKKYVKL